MLSFFFICCRQVQSTPYETSTLKSPKHKLLKSKPNYTYSIENHLKNYQKLLNDIKKDKRYYYRQNDLDRVRKVIYTLLNDSIFPYWYGTSWGYNGISEKPLEGSIACGYFVTTTLRDVGFPVQRISWAQEPSSVLIKKTCSPSSIKMFSNFSDLKNYLNKQSDQNLFILGLDSHVGFITKENNLLFFTHSSYTGEKMVKKELIEKSIPIISSKSFFIGNVLDNKPLLKRWLNS
ncbi:MAG: hypothetical protein ACK5HU_06000 [Flavobacteriales bacterium]